MINEPSDFSDLFETSETSNVQVTNLEILKLFKNIVDNNFNEGKENIESFIKKYLSSSEYEELRHILIYILEHADFEIIIRMFIDNNNKLSKLDIKDFYKNYLKDDIVFNYNKKNIELKLLPFDERSSKIEEIKKMRGQYLEHMKNKKQDKNVDKKKYKIPSGIDYDVKTGVPFFKTDKDKVDDNPEHMKEVEQLKKDYEDKTTGENEDKYYENTKNFESKNKEKQQEFIYDTMSESNMITNNYQLTEKINNEIDNLYDEDIYILKDNINNFVYKHANLYISKIFDEIKKCYKDEEIKILMYWYKNSTIYKHKFTNFYYKFAKIYEGDKQLVSIELNKSNNISDEYNEELKDELMKNMKMFDNNEQCVKDCNYESKDDLMYKIHVINHKKKNFFKEMDKFFKNNYNKKIYNIFKNIYKNSNFFILVKDFINQDKNFDLFYEEYVDIYFNINRLRYHLELRKKLQKCIEEADNDIQKLLLIIKQEFVYEPRIADIIVKNTVIKKVTKNIYSSLLNEIITSIPSEYLFELITSYLNQYDYTLSDFYLNFLNNSENMRSYNEQELLKDSVSKIKKVNEYINNKKISIDNLEKYDQGHNFDTNKEYFKLFTYRPWIKDFVINTYILNVDSDDFDEFIHKNKTFEIGDQTWYKINSKFLRLESCRNILKKQNDDVIEFYKKDDPNICLLKVKLGFKTNKDFIIQDVNIYNEEENFLKNLTFEVNSVTVNEILDEILTEDVKNIGYTLLRNAFDKIQLNIDIQQIILIFSNINLEKLTNREFAIYLSNIICYLDIDNISESIFIKRLHKNYYKLEKIIELTMEDKIPGLLFNEDKYSDEVKFYMNNKITKFLYNFGENLLLNKNIDLKYNNPSSNNDYDYTLNFTTIKNVCNLDSDNSEDYIYYESEHCLNIIDVLYHVYYKEEFDYFPELSDEFVSNIKEFFNDPSNINISGQYKVIENVKKDEEEDKDHVFFLTQDQLLNLFLLFSNEELGSLLNTIPKNKLDELISYNSITKDYYDPKELILNISKMSDLNLFLLFPDFVSKMKEMIQTDVYIKELVNSKYFNYLNNYVGKTGDVKIKKEWKKFDILNEIEKINQKIKLIENKNTNTYIVLNERLRKSKELLLNKLSILERETEDNPSIDIKICNILDNISKKLISGLNKSITSNADVPILSNSKLYLLINSVKKNGGLTNKNLTFNLVKLIIDDISEMNKEKYSLKFLNNLFFHVHKIYEEDEDNIEKEEEIDIEEDYISENKEESDDDEDEDDNDDDNDDDENESNKEDGNKEDEGDEDDVEEVNEDENEDDVNDDVNDDVYDDVYDDGMSTCAKCKYEIPKNNCVKTIKFNDNKYRGSNYKLMNICIDCMKNEKFNF